MKHWTTKIIFNNSHKWPHGLPFTPEALEITPHGSIYDYSAVILISPLIATSPVQRTWNVSGCPTLDEMSIS